MTNLKELPREHPLRNTPLRQIGGEVRNHASKVWRKMSTWTIGRATLNELSEDPWLKYNEWQAPEPK